MQSIIMLLMPIVVTFLTQQIKGAETIRFSQNKKNFVRMVALTLSFFGAVITGIIDGDGVPVAQVETYVQALLTFLATQIPYWYGKMNSRGTM